MDVIEEAGRGLEAHPWVGSAAPLTQSGRTDGPGVLRMDVGSGDPSCLPLQSYMLSHLLIFILVLLHTPFPPPPLTQVQTVQDGGSQCTLLALKMRTPRERPGYCRQ